MKKNLTAVITLAVLLGACGSTSDPIPQGTVATETKVEATPTETVSTCDRVREAFLTGTPAEKVAALKALVADKAADGTAREYASYWLGRDKADPTMQEMDQSLIVTICS